LIQINRRVVGECLFSPYHPPGRAHFSLEERGLSPLGLGNFAGDVRGADDLLGLATDRRGGSLPPAMVPWRTGKYWEKSICWRLADRICTRKSFILRLSKGKFPKRSNTELNRPNREVNRRNRKAPGKGERGPSRHRRGRMAV
jgi:hypothetical protein